MPITYPSYGLEPATLGRHTRNQDCRGARLVLTAGGWGSLGGWGSGPANDSRDVLRHDDRSVACDETRPRFSGEAFRERLLLRRPGRVAGDGTGSQTMADPRSPAQAMTLAPTT